MKADSVLSTCMPSLVQGEPTVDDGLGRMVFHKVHSSLLIKRQEYLHVSGKGQRYIPVLSWFVLNLRK